jgi:lipopolysaccharide biosynthesis regulator YciM
MGFLGKRKSSVEGYYYKILEALFHNNKKDAVTYLTELLKEKTDSSIAYLWLGKLLEEEGQVARSEVIFENLARRPRLSKEVKASAWKAAAKAARILNHNDKEIAALKVYSTLAPRDSIAQARYLYLKARRALKTDNNKEAVDCLNRCIKTDPRFGEAYRLLGDQYVESLPKKAIRVWRRILKIRPDLIVEYGPRVRELYDLIGNPQRYELFLKRLIMRSKNSGYPYLLLGRYYIENKDFKKAQENLEHASKINTTALESSIELINLAMERWDQKQAKRAASTIKLKNMLWMCGVCAERVVIVFLSSCPGCGNSTDIYIVTE